MRARFNAIRQLLHIIRWTVLGAIFKSNNSNVRDSRYIFIELYMIRARQTAHELYIFIFVCVSILRAHLQRDARCFCPAIIDLRDPFLKWLIGDAPFFPSKKYWPSIRIGHAIYMPPPHTEAIINNIYRIMRDRISARQTRSLCHL